MSFPRYKTSRESGVEWLGNVPEYWNVVPLFTVIVEREEPNVGTFEQNLLSLSYGRIVRKDINTNDGLLPESFETYQVVHRGDVIFRLTDLQNDKRSLRTAIVEETGIITSAYVAGAPFGVSPSYFNYLMRAYDLQKVFYSMGGGLRQSMKFSDLRRLPTLIPPPDEQAAISKFLDRETATIDALIAEQQNLIALLREKRQVVISRAVTKGLNLAAPMDESGIEWLGKVPSHWAVKAIRNIANVVRGASPRPAGDPLFFGGDAIPWVTVAEITKDQLTDLTETDTYLTEEGAKHSNLFKKGTVIYSNSGATLGVPKILGLDACANDGVIAFQRLSCHVHAHFLYHFLASITEAIREKVKQGSGQPNLNTDIVKALQIAVPPKAEQEMIVRHVAALTDQFASLAREAKRGIALLQERRAALISAAVTGKIDVRSLVAARPETEVAA